MVAWSGRGSPTRTADLEIGWGGHKSAHSLSRIRMTPAAGASDRRAPSQPLAGGGVAVRHHPVRPPPRQPVRRPALHRHVPPLRPHLHAAPPRRGPNQRPGRPVCPSAVPLAKLTWCGSPEVSVAHQMHGAHVKSNQTINKKSCRIPPHSVTPQQSHRTTSSEGRTNACHRWGPHQLLKPPCLTVPSQSKEAFSEVQPPKT